MQKAITTSFHLPVSIKEYINEESKKKNLNKGKFLAFLIEDYQKTKQENKNLKAYFSIATDKQFLQEQIAEAEADFVCELNHNTEFSA